MTDITNPIFNDEDKARAYLEKQRWPDGAFCPHCGETETVKPLPPKGSMGKGWYHCRKCRKKFTVRVGTLYERSHVPLHKWLLATHLMCASKKGMSAHQLHRMLAVTYKTAWFMSHRIREAMRDTNLEPMGGPGKIVEADETYFGRSENSKESPQRKGRPYIKRRKPWDKRSVAALVERGGNVRSFHVDRANIPTIRKIVTTNVTRDTRLMTDESGIYKALGKEYAEHGTVTHSAYEYVRGDVHTNTIEGYFSIFKRGMKGVYQHCREKHLHRYLAEFDFRYNARKISDTERAEMALKGIEGKRLTYRRIA